MRTTVLLVTIITSFAGTRLGSAQGDDSVPARAESLMSGGPRAWFGQTRAAITASLGRPTRVESRTAYPNKPRSRDSLVTFHYDGATFVFYITKGATSDILTEATVWQSNLLNRSPIILGASVGDVRSFFGDPSSGSTPHMFYSTTDVILDHLELWFDEDRLVRLKWIYGID